MAVVIPIYNERQFLLQMIERLDAAPLPAGVTARTLVLVDDGSTDGTRGILSELERRDDARVVLKERNEGKGSALAVGFKEALACGCELAVIQDADLEYDPCDHAVVVEPIVEGRADTVIGSRFLGRSHRVLYYWHRVANAGITVFSNMLSNLNLTDIECGFKAFSRPVLEKLEIRERSFGVEPEIIARLARMQLDDPEAESPRRLRIYEVPVSYAGRTYAEGKKIGWKDGVSALRCIAQRNLLG